jgi:hypothetical protein
MRFAMLAAALLAATLAHAQVPLSIGVPAGAPLSSEAIRAMCEETDAIWRGAGIAIAWRAGGAAPDLRVVFDDPAPVAHDRRSITLGWLVFDDYVPAPTIHLSYANTRRLLEESFGLVGSVDVMKPWHRETLVARALGRSLAHELGHYLLGSKVHTPSGLMRGDRLAAEMFQPGRSAFAIDQSARALAVSRLARVIASRE